MSMFFFRLHNLQREDAFKKKNAGFNQRRGGRVFKQMNTSEINSHLSLGPSRLFEKTPLNPSDSMDEIALKIPRYISLNDSNQIKEGKF